MNEEQMYTLSQSIGHLNAYAGLCRVLDNAREILRRYPSLPIIRGEIDIDEDPIVADQEQRTISARQEAMRSLIRDYISYRDMLPQEMWNQEPVRRVIMEILQITN